MIIEFFIDMFVNFLSPVLNMLDSVAFTIPVTVYVFLTDIMSYVNFFLPINQLQPLFLGVFGYYGARITMHVVKFLINLCHLGIE